MAVTRVELVARARELAPKIGDRALESEEMRKPHDETIQELIDADLLGVLVPEKWNGHELDLDSATEIVFEISRACMSTGWITAFYIGHNWMVTRFEESVQAEVFDGKNHALIPISSAAEFEATAVDGGWEITGRAPWGSGIMHADWVMITGAVEGGRRTFILPRSDVEIGDVWHMSGMSGTGSNDVVVKSVFVPEKRTLDQVAFTSGRTLGSLELENPLYRMPLLPFLQCEIAGVYAGGLRGAVDAFDASVKARARNHTGGAVKGEQYSHLQLGDAHIRAEIAEDMMWGHIRRTIQRRDDAAFDMPTRVRSRAQMSYLVDHCRRSVNDVISWSGAASFHKSLPLQRFFRDINMLATHAFFEWDISREQYGRSKLGLEPTHPLL